MYSYNISYFLAYFVRLLKNGSQVYIFITCKPEIISFIKCILSSVLMAVFNRISEVFDPNHTKMLNRIINCH